MDQPLSAEIVRKMDAYWRAANYLSVGQIYLFDNPLLKEPLRHEHIKPRLLGHWGTTPGLNFIYVHLNRAIKQYDLNTIYITGPGHGAPGIVANTYLEGTYSELYPNISQDETGHEAAVHAVFLSRRHPQPRAPRKRPARSTRGANWAIRSRTPTARSSTIPTCWPRASSATARPKPARWPPVGTRTSSSTRSATARCCRSCT